MKISNQIKSITIGSFDGLHLAHQELISQADMTIVIERNSGYLTPGYKRSEFTDKPVTIYHFDKIKSLSPEAFIGKLQEDFPSLEKIVVGYDFHFGHAKSGNAHSLKVLFTGETLIVEQILLDNTPIHSRIIKKMLQEGDIISVNKLLGRRYSIEGRVIRGQGLGAKSLVPTLNLKVDYYQLPHDGVYVTKTKIHGMWIPSVSFIGHRSTTDGSFAVETHILDKRIENMTGNISISFVEKLRDNKKFNDLSTLKQQIDEDIHKSKKALR
ncbi:MAG: bifunctional riboflavin kinase/FAD synthetase [Sulfurovum sp.]|nr:bifunctional riboflavin kinase/FAD synthetase [Sulfurovum sp.]